MDEDTCVMEEKSLLSAHSIIRSKSHSQSSLSGFATADVPNYTWLPDDLRKKIVESCEDVRTRQGYPVIDWLRQIRSNCDFCEVGITSDSQQTTSFLEDGTDTDYIDSIASVIDESIELDDITDNPEIVCKYYDDIVACCEEEISSHIYDELPCDNTSQGLFTSFNNRNNLEADVMGENIRESRNIRGGVMDSRIVCCVELKQNDKGFFSDKFGNDSVEELPDLALVDDDNCALKSCERFLEDATSDFGEFQRYFPEDVTSFCGSDKNCRDESRRCGGNYLVECEIEVENFCEDGPKCCEYSGECSDFCVTDGENNLALASEKGSFNVALSDWRKTLNNFDDLGDVDEVVYDEVASSDELLYDSCNNSGNIDVEDTDYKYFGSESLSQQRLIPECDEETSFEDNGEHIYENLWGANEGFCLDGSSASSGETGTSDFCSPDFQGDREVVVVDEVEEVEEVEKEEAVEGVETVEEVSDFRRRKGSTSSDIVMWRNLLLLNCEDEDDFQQWFSSNDAEGKIYFFEENSNESSWVLPTISPGKSHPKTSFQSEEKIDRNSVSMNDVSLTKNTSSTSLPASQSLANRDLPSKKSGTSLSDWPQLFDGNMRVLKEGAISRTKITENGKKLRKNWSTSYAVLTELFLLFFKDAKTFATVMKSGQSSVVAKPDISVDLNGALIEPGERASSRKNVYMISTFLGLQVLIQSDNTALAAEWFQEIHGVIRKLPSSSKSQAKPFTGAAPEMRKISTNKSPGDSKGSEESKRSSKIARSRSMKMKGLDDSLEDLSGTVAERQTKIKAKLRRFFLRRPTVESLVKNGIYKDEPAFGSYLADVCPPDHPRVPLFVKTCIEVLESNEDNMKTDGLYRASGNLSQIQKIRLQVDQYNLSVLSQEEDVHVLTGALKLFFRELKEPLIPSSFFKEALNASMLKKTSAKIQCFREIVKALPPPNYDTLQFLLKHLLKVTSYQEYNRMHIPNLAIVFGPTLMWPAEESANMALDLMQQNLVIECLLSEYNKIFK